eukprot:scaffold33963_cov70-Cyclotella_meneghiniana.AAC.4
MNCEGEEKNPRQKILKRPQAQVPSTTSSLVVFTIGMGWNYDTAHSKMLHLLIHSVTPKCNLMV